MLNRVAARALLTRGRRLVLLAGFRDKRPLSGLDSLLLGMLQATI